MHNGQKCQKSRKNSKNATHEVKGNIGSKVVNFCEKSNKKTV